MFKKLLIANRGEIACRIIRSAQAMGLHCTVVYSTVDRNSEAVRKADNAVCIGEAKSNESYLNISRIIQVAIEHEIEAVHPGYGFLSENAEFAKACEKAGIIFVGPGIKALESMASKQLAKQILQSTNVPLTPGYHGDNQDEAHLLKEARTIGFPVLLKAALGGGGKGMRAVYSAKAFSEALAGARREAAASFGNDKMIIEKLVEQPRHVEVQIMADNHGNIVHLFERDCSIQRRHQKIIEEAPAPHLKDDIRQKMYEAAITVARQINYRGAGTVEFLLAPDDKFYFMEMNTRLQVEHPVSEMITQLDFVAWQLKIAAGEPLPLQQSDIKAQGHAIECRIYAEDPEMNFMPSPGRILYLYAPSGPGVRIDSGVQQGDSISQYYDPMIAKLICHGDNRTEALMRLQQALENYQIDGVKHNIPFLKTLCEQPEFKDAKIHTGYLEQHPVNLSRLSLSSAIKFIACDHFNQIWNACTDPLYQKSFSWQNSVSSYWHTCFQIENTRVYCRFQPVSSHCFQLQWEDINMEIHFEKNGAQFSIIEDHSKDQAKVIHQGNRILIFHPQGQAVAQRIDDPYNTAQHDATGRQLTAPMPATVVAVLKKAGEPIKSGEAIMVLEAMKMEHTIHAPQDGIISEIFYSVGSQVSEGDQLLALENECMESA